jgi:hypothetical protein
MLKYCLYFLLLLLINSLQILYSQNDLSTSYKIAIQDSKLCVKDQANNIVYERLFYSPVGKFVDFNHDGLDEYFVKDAKVDGAYTYYTAYVFSQKDSFCLVDSVYSGLTEPSVIVSDEVNTTVLVTGQPELDSLNILYNPDNLYTSFNCFKFEKEKFYNANDEFYDIFVNENDLLISYIEKEYNKNSKQCAKTKMLKPAIAAVYLNLLKASEVVMAKQFINNYYFCEDKEEFIKFLKDLQ